MSQPSLVLFAMALLATGGVSGFLAGLLGVGGGIVVVPVLYMLFPALGVDESVRMHLAVGTSLAAIVPTAFTSSRAHFRRGALDAELLRAVGPAIFAGVLLGVFTGGRSRGTVLALVFAVVALLVAVYMAFRRDDWILAPVMPRSPWVRVPLGMAIGGLSVLMGIGGGTLGVPIFSAFGVPIKRAVGTGAAVGLVIGIPGCIGFVASGWGNPALPPLSLGYVSLVGLCLIVPATVLTAPYGVRTAHSLNPVMLRRAFALFLLLTSVKMFASLA